MDVIDTEHLGTEFEIGSFIQLVMIMPSLPST